MRDKLNDLASSSVFAEEALVVDVQSALHQIMEKAGLSRADLARRMDVSRARVTQMFSDECPNLTLRLVARAFHALGERVEISCESLRDHAKRCDQDVVRHAVQSHDNVVLGGWQWKWESETPLISARIRSDAIEPEMLEHALSRAEDKRSAAAAKKSNRERRPKAEDWLQTAAESSSTKRLLAVANG